MAAGGGPHVSGADHILPSVAAIVHRSAAEAQDRISLCYQTVGDVLTDRKSIEAPPDSGLYEDMPDIDRPRLLQLDGEPAMRIVAVWCKREVISGPVWVVCRERSLGVHFFAVWTFKRNIHCRGGGVSEINVAIIRLGCLDVHSPAV